MSDGLSKEEIDRFEAEANETGGSGVPYAYSPLNNGIHYYPLDRIRALCAEVRRLQSQESLAIGLLNQRAETIKRFEEQLQILTARLERKDEWLDFMFNEVKEFSETILSQLQSAREKSVEKELENPCKHGQHPFVCLLCWDEN